MLDVRSCRQWSLWQRLFGRTSNRMKTRRFTLAVLLAIMLALRGSLGTATGAPASGPLRISNTNYDDCRVAVMHYETEDIPSSDVLGLFEKLARKGDVRG